jgi:hypothetical protein
MSDTANEKRKIAFLNINDVLNKGVLIPCRLSEAPVFSAADPVRQNKQDP